MLESLLRDPVHKARIALDCVRLIEAEVADKRGITGMALRAGFAAFQRIQPGILPATVERLLPDLAPALEPHWVAARAAPEPEASFAAQATAIANDLLGVTDRIAARARSAVLAQLYRSLRPTAHDHVRAAVPRLAGLLRAHVG